MDLPARSDLYQTCLPVARALRRCRIVLIDGSLDERHTMSFSTFTGSGSLRANLPMLEALSRAVARRSS